MRPRFVICIIALSFPAIPVFAQQVKKTTTVQKRTTAKKTVVKKTTIARVKKPVTKKTTVTVKSGPVKPPVNKNLTIAELNMSDKERQMVDEINLVRSDPAGYAKYVAAYLKKADEPTKEMKASAKELMEELKKTRSLNTLTISPALYVDAREYGKEMLLKNIIEHSSLPYNENLSFGFENVRDAVIDLLIDEGIPDRDHRRNILKKNITMVAVHEIPGKVEDFSYCYIQEFK